MKNLFCLFVVLLCSYTHAQICSIDFGQTATGIYPDTLPTATVGQSYGTDVTFVMPLDTLGFDFTNFQILSVSLPVGLSWQCNQAQNNCQYNPQQNQYGCVHIGGTPLLAGQYSIEVTVLADLTIIQDYPYTFHLYLTILPNNTQVSNNGFDMYGSSGCAPITVQFQNNNPGMLSYLWNFGNGNISLLENPAPQVYANPGDYVVYYSAWNNQDTTSIFTLNNVHVSSMTNYGYAFPSYDQADTYFKLFQNGTLIYQSAIIVDQNPPVQWTTSINLNPNASFVIEIWEADQSVGETILGADDFMGSHLLNFNGCNGCAAGTAIINYTIQHQFFYPSASIISQDTVHVYGYPPTPIIQFDANNYVLSTPDLGYSYQWYLNAGPILGATTPNYVIHQSGTYQVIAINSTGCAQFSDTLTAVYCAPTIHPNLHLNSENQLVLTNYPSTYTIHWYLNGSELTNEWNDTIVPTSNGNYYALITNSYGCSYQTNELTISVSIPEMSPSSWTVFPNPTKGESTIQLDEKFIGATLDVLDLNGRSLLSLPIITSKFSLDFSHLSKGTYFVRLKSIGVTQSNKLIIE